MVDFNCPLFGFRLCPIPYPQDRIAQLPYLFSSVDRLRTWRVSSIHHHLARLLAMAAISAGSNVGQLTKLFSFLVLFLSTRRSRRPSLHLPFRRRRGAFSLSSKLGGLARTAPRQAVLSCCICNCRMPPPPEVAFLRPHRHQRRHSKRSTSR